MIPRVAQRGHSFKGAGDYYLHDKEADTSERVGWTHTHNLPTNDPQKAMKVMAFTAIHSDDIKRQAGTKTTGRKATAGSVYSFSLAWHPEQRPDKNEMLDASMSTLDKLGLNEHQAVIVSHQETNHPHVHIICNLVNPETGKTASVSHDQLKLSKWAEEYEIKTGQVYCNDRVENNRKREELAQQKSDTQEKTQSAIVKHREKRNERADMVQKLYKHSDSGKAFKSALEENDLTLAKGDRRGYVLVDRDGDIFSLSRQLKGQRASDIKTRLSDVIDLRHAKELSDERKYFDRDQYEVDRQKALVDNAIKADNLKSKKPSEIHEISGLILSEIQDKIMFARIEYDRKADKVLKDKQDELDQFYDRKGVESRIKQLGAKIQKLQKKGKFTLQRMRPLKEQLTEAKRDLKQINWRTEEQLGKIRKENEANRPDAYNEEKIKKELVKRLSVKRSGGQSRINKNEPPRHNRR